MPTISLAIQKGGSGKTTTAINLAAALQQLRHKVLLVDLDPQANLTHSVGLEEEPDPSIYHMLRKEGDGEDADLTEIIIDLDGLDVVPASIELAGAELDLVRIYGREFLLQRMLEPLQKKYDFIIIDCPPAIGMLTVNALIASDYVVMPMQAEYLHYKGVKSFLHHFDKLKKSLKPKMEILGFVLTKFDPRQTMNQKVQTQMLEQFGNKVFKTTIRTNIALAKAQEKGVDIFHYDKTCNGAIDYIKLAKEFLDKIEEEEQTN